MADETPIADSVPTVVPAELKQEQVKGPKKDLGNPPNVRNRDVVNENPERDRIRAGGGVFLDDVQRREAEKIRAKVEGREPNLDNPPAIAGTHLRA